MKSPPQCELVRRLQPRTGRFYSHLILRSGAFKWNTLSQTTTRDNLEEGSIQSIRNSSFPPRQYFFLFYKKCIQQMNSTTQRIRHENDEYSPEFPSERTHENIKYPQFLILFTRIISSCGLSKRSHTISKALADPIYTTFQYFSSPRRKQRAPSS